MIRPRHRRPQCDGQKGIDGIGDRCGGDACRPGGRLGTVPYRKATAQPGSRAGVISFEDAGQVHVRLGTECRRSTVIVASNSLHDARIGHGGRNTGHADRRAGRRLDTATSDIPGVARVAYAAVGDDSRIDVTVGDCRHGERWPRHRRRSGARPECSHACSGRRYASCLRTIRYRRKTIRNSERDHFTTASLDEQKRNVVDSVHWPIQFRRGGIHSLIHRCRPWQRRVRHKGDGQKSIDGIGDGRSGIARRPGGCLGAVPYREATAQPGIRASVISLGYAGQVHVRLGTERRRRAVVVASDSLHDARTGHGSRDTSHADRRARRRLDATRRHIPRITRSDHAPVGDDPCIKMVSGNSYCGRCHRGRCGACPKHAHACTGRADAGELRAIRYRRKTIRNTECDRLTSSTLNEQKRDIVDGVCRPHRTDGSRVADRRPGSLIGWWRRLRLERDSKESVDGTGDGRSGIAGRTRSRFDPGPYPQTAAITIYSASVETFEDAGQARVRLRAERRRRVVIVARHGLHDESVRRRSGDACHADRRAGRRFDATHRHIPRIAGIDDTAEGDDACIEVITGAGYRWRSHHC